MRIGTGLVVPDTGNLYSERGPFFSTDPEHPNFLEPQKDLTNHHSRNDYPQF
ncbi:MAG: hypothetical protein CM1200mP30_19880 [Pseudomonadota bacterium]|nr:MAG: hypothetical protein CM1200mP30_19880 [Pseudomonadota bacterium]